MKQKNPMANQQKRHYSPLKPYLSYSEPFFLTSLFILIVTMLTLGCSPRVAVEVPDKPITINLNVKIDHEVRVKVEKDLEQIFSENSDLF